MEIVDVVSDGRSAAPPARSGAPQLEQKRLFSALRLPHLVHTRADIGENPPPVLEVDGCPKPMSPDCAGSTDGAPWPATWSRNSGRWPSASGCARWRAVWLSLLSFALL